MLLRSVSLLLPITYC